jgi:hypothetical protein
MAIPAEESAPVISYSVLDDNIQCDNSLRLYPSGRYEAVQKMDYLVDGSEEILSGSLGQDKVADLVQRVKSAVSGASREMCLGYPGSSSSHSVSLRAEDVSLSYADEPPSKEVKKVVAELENLFYSLPWPEKIEEPAEEEDSDKRWDHGLPESTHHYHLEDE